MWADENPIRVLLVHRHNDHYRKLTGWWSYAVPEFEWEEYSVEPVGFKLDLRSEQGRYDLIVLDDWTWGTLKHPGIPLAYVVVDSARSDDELQRNLKQAQQADLVLVDSDELGKFKQPVRRFAYAVNEKLFCPHPKPYDVAFICWPTPPRRVVQELCREICERHNWKYLTGTWDRAADYAAAIGSAKVVVHWAHVPLGRSWRVFDVMASRGCLLSSPLPAVSGDGFVDGVHYHTYTGSLDLEGKLAQLLEGDAWAATAQAGYEHVMACHTWATRAAQLRTMVMEVFKW